MHSVGVADRRIEPGLGELRGIVVAPDVPHALHMPSHILTRLGMWQQSIDSNRAAHTAALDYVHKTRGPGSYDQETLHTMDYLEYAYLQIAQDGPAKEVVDELIGFR